MKSQVKTFETTHQSPPCTTYHPESKIDFRDHVDNSKRKDSIDLICEQLELGIEPYRWSVAGNVNSILRRMESRGTIQPHHYDILWNLSDSADESL